MGLEATCLCRWSGGEAPVKALLESHELILRGALKRRLPIADMLAFAATGEDLTITMTDGAYSLALGTRTAAFWAEKLAKPPPTLKAKLGITEAGSVCVIGAIGDEALSEAAFGASAAVMGAKLSIAQVDDEHALAVVLDIHAAAPARQPLWLVYPKGSKGPLNEAAVRRILREAGYADSKSCAVSATHTATRYAKP